VGRHLRIIRWNKNSNSPQGLTSKLTNAVTISWVVRRATQAKLGARSTERHHVKERKGHAGYKTWHT